MADADAIWLNNPFTDLNKCPKADIISSRASFPKDSFRRYGATLCMGFIYFKATKSMKHLFHDFGIVMSRIGSEHADDQRDLNFLLLKNKLTFPKRLLYLNSTKIDIGEIDFRGSYIQIALLPHESYRRICDKMSKEVVLNSVILHCLEEKDSNAKKTVSRHYGTW
jgi:hypothetical protein